MLEFDPTLARLLEQDPVSKVTLPYGHDGPWLVSRYADIKAVTNDKRLTRAPLGVEVEIPRLMPAFVPPRDAVQLKDAPKASDLREAMGRGITSRRMTTFRPVAQAIVTDLLDAVADEPGPVDLMAALTGRFPLDVMAHLIGIPPADLPAIRRWTSLMFSTRPEERESTLAAKQELGEYSASLVKARKTRPGNDLLSRMVADPDGKFTDGELIGMTVQMIAVGIAPSNSLLSNICYLLMTDDRLAAIRAEPRRIRAAFAELARFTPVIQGFGPPLVAAADLELGGVSIKSGDVLVYSYTSGNHDPRAFPDPDELDLDRPNVKHLTFGAGVHACVAQHFAKLVVTTAVEALLTRFPDVRLAVATKDLDWDNGTIWRAPVRLPVVLRG